MENKLVLIVDDEKDITAYLKMALEDNGFQVQTASDGQEAMECVKKQKPDLISLDLVMPKGSGLKFYRELQKDKELSKIPVIIVTGHARDELGKADFSEMMMSGPGIYLEKPITAETYTNAVKKTLGMEITSKEVDPLQLKDQVKSFVEFADPETLKKIFQMLKKNS
jgi:CheY-like chemotaxis protein